MWIFRSTAMGKHRGLSKVWSGCKPMASKAGRHFNGPQQSSRDSRAIKEHRRPVVLHQTEIKNRRSIWMRGYKIAINFFNQRQPNNLFFSVSAKPAHSVLEFKISSKWISMSRLHWSNARVSPYQSLSTATIRFPGYLWLLCANVNARTQDFM
jgi:hypothetical protein